MIQHNPISPKVTAGVGGGGAGVLTGVILVWLLTSNGVDVPELVGSAIGGLLTIIFSSVSAYLKRDPLRDPRV